MPGWCVPRFAGAFDRGQNRKEDHRGRRDEGWAGLGELSIRTDAHMIDADDIDERSDIPSIVQRCVGQMRPDADHAAGVGDHFGRLFADESRASCAPYEDRSPTVYRAQYER
jgi:hypothetical protein